MLTEREKQRARDLVGYLYADLRGRGYRLLPVREVRFGRGLRVFGSCRRHIERGKGATAVTIYLGEVCFHAQPYTLLATIVHELIHAMPDTKGHDEKFQKYARELSKVYGVPVGTHAMPAEWEAAKTSGFVKFRYEVKCTGCGATSRFLRRTKLVEAAEKGDTKEWRCRVCGGSDFVLES